MLLLSIFFFEIFNRFLFSSSIKKKLEYEKFFNSFKAPLFLDTIILFEKKIASKSLDDAE